VFVVSVPFAFQATSSLKSGFGEVETESRIALRLMSERLELPESSVTLVFSSDSLDASDPRYVEAVERATAPLSQIPQVDRLITFNSADNNRMIAPDGRTTYAFVLLDADIDAATDLVPDIREALRPGDDLDIWVTGGVAIFSDLNVASEQDLRRAEIITLPLLIVALLIVFGGVIAAGLPLAMGALSVVITLALVHLLAQFTDMSIFVLNIASFLGLGMAVDYSLLMVSRFREELVRHEVTEAVQNT
jgi:RND superfamily putative drug exporter